ncbi:glycosyltransferase [Mucilaginibacter ximonensis]|uniref:Glycosyltransferase n=1 Tax=Mucilaginibacter ximonensis TaxID=538021 RepID=A0ABW5YDW0_9SPHI
MISIIICSVNEQLSARVSANIKNTIGLDDFEIIIINNTQNQYSIAQAYNQGAFGAKYPYLCFIHEDILFHTENWGQYLIQHLSVNSVSLVGVLGSLIKTVTPSGVFIPIKQLNRVNQLQRKYDGGIDHYYDNPFDEKRSRVATLDGMFLAVTKSNHQKYPFDEESLTGFHAYDIDYSLGQAANGDVVVVYDILIEHFSYGGNTQQWVEAQLALTDKWKALLPYHTSLTKPEIKAAEIINTESFLIALYANRYPKSTQLKYLTRLLWLRPLSVKNLYFIRKFVLGGTVDNRIKNMLKRC